MKKFSICFGGFLLLLAASLVFGQDVGGRNTAESLMHPRVTGVAVTNDAVDVRDYIGTLKVVQSVGILTGTTPTNYGVLLTSTGSVASGTWTAVTNGTFADVTSSTNIQSLTIDTRLLNRYLRYHLTLAGTTPTGVVSVVMIGTKQTQ